MTTAADNWQPGDPLYTRVEGSHGYYLFNFRDDPTSDACHCNDRADWPQQTRRPLHGTDEIRRLIAQVRLDRIHALQESP